MEGLSAQIMAVFWVFVCIGMAVMEGVTAQLVSIWFAAGAAIAAIAAILGASKTTQSVIFLSVSILMLLILQPFIKKFRKTVKHSTNADRVIGQVGVVLESIDNDLGTGRVRVMGLDWTARTQNGIIVPEGEKVRVLGIQGVKLMVEPMEVLQPADAVDTVNAVDTVVVADAADTVE